MVPDMYLWAAVSFPGSEHYKAFFVWLPFRPLLLTLFASAWHSFHFLLAVIDTHHVIWALTVLNSTLHGSQSRQDLRKEDNFFSFSVKTFILWLWIAALPASTQSLCYNIMTTGGSCAKWKADGMGKEVSYINSWKVFVGVCVVLFSQYVPLLITSDQFFQLHRKFMQF